MSLDTDKCLVIPFGYRFAADGVSLERDDEEQKTLAMLQALKADGYSEREIAEELTRQGFRLRSGIARKVWIYEAKTLH